MEKESTVGCPRCGGIDLIIDQEMGEAVCGECGVVISENIVDRGPEWRAFTASEKDSRMRTGSGKSYALYDKGLSTSFDLNKDAHGNRLNVETRTRMRKLKRYDNRSKTDDSWARNLSIAMGELGRMTTNLHIPKTIKEQAALIYRRALKKDLIRGRSIDAFVAASLYAACRLNKIPRTLKKVARESTREHSEVARTYRLLLRELKLKMPIDDPMKFVSGIASKLDVRRETELHAIEILRKARERRALSGKDPRGLAAAALYMACVENNDRRIQKQVAAAAGTTEVTLRNRMRGLEATLQDQIQFGEDQHPTVQAE